MSSKLNAFGNCILAVKGTGTGPCAFETFGDYLGMSLFDKGLKFAVTAGSVAFDDAIYGLGIQDRKIHPLIRRMNFTQDTPENEVFTDPTGLESSIRDAKPKMTTMYSRGGENAKAIHSLKHDNRWDGALIFTKGLLVTSDVAGENLKGFDIGRFDVSTIKFLAGTDKQQISTMAQFTSPDEFNKRHVFLTWEQIGADLSQQDGVIDVNITVVAPVAASATTFEIDAFFADNTESPVLGLLTANLRIGGTQTTPKTVTLAANTSVPGRYTVTASSAFITGDTYKPTLRDTSKDVAVDTLGKYLAGSSALGTVA